VAGLPSKRFVDIEWALRWAYRDELPKRDRAAMPPATSHQHVWSPYLEPMGYGDTSPMFREGIAGGPSGGYVEGWSRDPGFPRALGGPHPDAVAIARAVEGLAAWAGHSFGPDDAASLMQGFDLAAWRADIDHIQIVVEAVAMMPGLVAGHACAKTRPIWSKALPDEFLDLPKARQDAMIEAKVITMPLPDKGRNGKERVLVDETFIQVVDRRGRARHEPTRDPLPPGAISYREPVASPHIRKDLYREGTYCPLVYRPAPGGIVAARAEYAAWRCALELLAEQLAGTLASIAPLPPAAPWRPWAGEGERHGRSPQLFAGLRDEPYRRETRKQAGLRREEGKRRSERDMRAEQTRPVTMPAKGVGKKLSR
jgi:hypothetical protein